MDQKQDDGVRKRQLKNTAAYAVAGGIVIAAILLITTIWVSNSARGEPGQWFLSGGAGRAEGTGGFGGAEK